MKSYLNLIPISAKLHRKQSRMTRICIILAVFLVTAMFGLADMYLQGEIIKRTQASGNWHYQFSSLDTDTATLISVRPEVTVSGWHSTLPTDTGYTFAGQPVAISGQERTVFEDIYLGTVTEGNYPNVDNEIAVSSNIKERYSLHIGDKFELTLPDGGSVPFTVTGVVDDTERLITESEQVIVLTPKGISALAAITNITTVETQFVIQLSRLCNMPDTVADIMKQLSIPDTQVMSNLSLLSILGQVKGNNPSQIYIIAFGLSIIVMLTCVLMISSSLHSNVMQRTEFFGMLRCLGASKKQIMRFIRCESLYWCITAIPTGILGGIIVVWILSAVMRAISPTRLSYMPVLGISWASIFIGVVLGLLTVLLAARSPAKKAARVSPLEAVSGNAYETTLFRKAASTRLFKIETALGLHHAHASKKNFILMTGAFAICIVLFLAFTTVIDFMKNAMLPLPWTPELSIVSEDNTCSIERSLLEKVHENNTVKRVYGRMFAYSLPAIIQGKNANTNLISYEEHQFAWAANELSEGSLEPVMREEKQVLLVKSELLPVHAGDTITLIVNGKEQTVTVAGILADSPLARDAGTETVICSENTFESLTGQSNYTILDIQFKGNATEYNVAEIESYFSDGVIFTDKLSAVREQRNFYYAFAVLVYGFLSIIAAITVFHIMNTISMSVSAKLKQYGAMRAIGMSNHQMLRMIISEAAAYAVTGSIMGCILGVPLHMVIFLSLITTFWGIPWSFPFMGLGIIVGIVLITTFIAVRGPSKRIRNLSIVDTINAQ